MSVVISYNIVTVDEFFADICSTHAFSQLIDWPILLIVFEGLVIKKKLNWF